MKIYNLYERVSVANSSTEHYMEHQKLQEKSKWKAKCKPFFDTIIYYSSDASEFQSNKAFDHLQIIRLYKFILSSDILYAYICTKIYD